MWQMVCLVGAHMANIIIYNYIFKYLKSHLSIVIFKKNPCQKKKKNEKSNWKKKIYYFL